MNKNDIYVAIGYKGKYDNLVKKNLKKLMKKYHPDINKKDNNTIKLLLEVKKELESNSVQYNPPKNNDKTDIKQEEDYMDKNKINILIDNLKQKVNKFKDELLKLYKNINYQYKVQEVLLKDNNKLELDIDILETEQNKISKITNLELINILIIIVLTIFLFFKFNILVFLIIFLLLLLEFLLYYNRNLKLKDINNILVNNLLKKDKLQKEINKRNNIISNKEKEILKLKQEMRKVNNDIAFYNNVLNKSEDKNLYKNKNNSYSKKKI